ncbi:MAG: Crp/Fnr family transcriptional regulator [Lewinella sp.]|jgi:CRP-like cAMP-binding protein|uniref:Crp/Fnr family transcriptional regulator n=1 Tax=Lewinella sp. TaxID=2004506 RepID=UPI003D6AA413
MNTIHLAKGEVVQRSGDLYSKVYVVKKGLLRSYAIDEKGKEHVFMFAPEGWIVADNQPPSVPCDLFIDALEDSVVSVLTKESARENVDIDAIIKRVSVLQKRIILLMSAPAIRRYEDFEATYPDIIQRVPQKMIASYLGITPEALSKVKGERKHGSKNSI